MLAGGGPSTLFVVVVGYTAFTLAMMAQFGRDTWRSNGETFTVWFRLLGRLAAFAPRRRGRSCPSADRSRAACSSPAGRVADVTLAALGCRSILFDGLSQTQAFFDLFGAPARSRRPLLLFAWLGVVVALATLVLARTVGLAAIGAGLLPIAVGYLIAHYLTYLLIDGQHILVAISDPFQQGWDLFGTAFYQPHRRLAAAWARVDDPARGRRRRAHAGRVGRSCVRGRGRACRDSRPRPDSPSHRSRSRS